MRSPAENSSVSSTQAFFLPCPGGGANAKLAEKIHGLQWTDDQGQMVVNWPLHYQPGQRVLTPLRKRDSAPKSNFLSVFQ